MNENKQIEVTVKLDTDQFEFLDDIAKSLRVGVDDIILNATIAGILSASNPKDEARLHYVTKQARIDKWWRLRPVVEGDV